MAVPYVSSIRDNTAISDDKALLDQSRAMSVFGFLEQVSLYKIDQARSQKYCKEDCLG
jgi:hypothetical protein